MKIVYAVAGSRGDTQPHIAFAVELARAGHHVKLLIPPDYQSLVPTVKRLDVSLGKRTVAALMEKLAPHIATGNTDAALTAMFTEQGENFKQDADAVKAVCEGWAEILVFNAVMQNCAYAVSEVLQLRMLHANVQPLLPTQEAFLLAGKLQLPKCLHMFLWKLLLSKIVFPEVLEQAITRWKADNGCMRPAFKPWDVTYRFNAPHLFGFSPESFAPPADWAPFDYVITGDWILSPDDLPETPEPKLVEFLRAGKEPPLYIGWGSMAHESGTYMTELAVRALRTAGKRGVVFAGSNGSELFRLGLDKLDPSKPDAAELAAWAADNVLVTSGVSHEWLFPKVAAIAHHGGAGTSAASFRSGVPSIVTPFNFDQFEYSRLTIKHGLGPGPLPEFKAVTVEQLGAALLDAAREPKYKAAAAVLRDQVQQEHGTKLAVDAFEELRHRHIWEEDAKRQARGVEFAVAPPSFICCLESKKAQNTLNPATQSKRASLGQYPTHQQKTAGSRRTSFVAAAAGLTE